MIKIINALEDSGILVEGITKTIENHTKERKGGFLGMLLGKLRTEYANKQGQRIVRIEFSSKMDF